MANRYVIGIDQSTQGTKALLFDEAGALVQRADLPHRQIVSEEGWVSHDPEEIYQNTIGVVKLLLKAAGIGSQEVAGVGISNQRETSLIWERGTGRPLADAVVWQCARAADLCSEVEQTGMAEAIRQRTGLPLSPYFPAAKLGWLLRHTEGAREKAAAHTLCCGTVDSWLVYRLTGGAAFKTDYSNASRTQLFDIFRLCWDEELCRLFAIPPDALPQVCPSDSCFGMSDFEGLFPQPVPIHGVLGDSHGALLGQGCLTRGMIKATYGTGSSIMMQIGDTPVHSAHGVVTSLAWGLGGKVSYVLEGNINYTGAVISWLRDEVGLIASPAETEALCLAAEREDALYFIPAFTGLGAPYWDTRAKGALVGITRTTRKPEIVRACIECIAYQIADVLRAMSQDASLPIQELRVDGGPTQNRYLMQFQSDILGADVLAPAVQELSGTGAAYAAGLGLGLYSTAIFSGLPRQRYTPKMEQARRAQKYSGWQSAVRQVLTR